MNCRRGTRSAITAPSGVVTAIAMNRAAVNTPTAVAPPSR
jgi:hypothetical protein